MSWGSTKAIVAFVLLLYIRLRNTYIYILLFLLFINIIVEYTNEDSLSSASIGSQILPRSVVGFAGTKEPISRLCRHQTWLLGPGKGVVPDD
jgi:hypothetical protein